MYGTYSGVIVLYFCVCNALWRYCVIFSTCVGPARGTRSGIIVLYLMHVERVLALLCEIHFMC